jgi:YedE family putative selenium metabolism protein
MGKASGVSRTALWLGGGGLIIGAVAAWLVSQGNPGNMGLCIACFLRDTVGFFAGGSANMGAVAYIRPELVGLPLGALAAALSAKEFRARGGSAPLIRFALGFAFMAGALVFLGCTVRAWLRLGGGDLSALAGIAGIVFGVWIGTVLLRRGFDLGRAGKLGSWAGWVTPALFAALLLVAALWASGVSMPWATTTPPGAKSTAEKAVIAADGATVLKPAGAKLVDGAVVGADGTVVSAPESVKAAKAMPGGKRAPFLISLIAGLLLGVVAQRTRFCTIGGVRDSILWKRFDLLLGIAGLVVGAAVVNLVFGQFNLGFANQPVAHTDILGSFAGMSIAGLSAVMLGGCPFRQVIMSGEGDADAGMAVLGMAAGALAAHGLNVASSAKGLAPLGWPMLAVMAVLLTVIAFAKRGRATS